MGSIVDYIYRISVIQKSRFRHKLLGRRRVQNDTKMSADGIEYTNTAGFAAISPGDLARALESAPTRLVDLNSVQAHHYSNNNTADARTRVF